jgi:hypothetical protein
MAQETFGVQGAMERFKTIGVTYYMHLITHSVGILSALLIWYIVYSI